MAHQIIKQPNGKFLVFSIVDNSILLLDKTEEELVEHFLKIEEDKLRRAISGIVAKIDQGVKPYYQFTKTVEEAVDMHNRYNDAKVDIKNL